MIDNRITWAIGKIMPAFLHRHFSKISGCMFAAVWLRDGQMHKWMWVNEKRYYSGELQSIHAALNHQVEGGA